MYRVWLDWVHSGPISFIVQDNTSWYWRTTEGTHVLGIRPLSYSTPKASVFPLSSWEHLPVTTDVNGYIDERMCTPSPPCPHLHGFCQSSLAPSWMERVKSYALVCEKTVRIHFIHVISFEDGSGVAGRRNIISYLDWVIRISFVSVTVAEHNLLMEYEQNLSSYWKAQLCTYKKMKDAKRPCVQAHKAWWVVH